MHNHEAACFLDRIDDGLAIKGRNGSQINDFNLNAFLGELFPCLGHLVNIGAPSCHRDRVTFPHNLGLTDGDGVVFLWYLLAERPVDLRRLEEEYGVGITDGRKQQSLRIIGSGRHHNLQPRNMAENSLKAFRMVFQRFDAAPMRHADHQWKSEPAPSAVPHASYVGNYLVVGRIHKAGKLDFRYWAKTVDGHAHRHAHNRSFR